MRMGTENNNYNVLICDANASVKQILEAEQVYYPDIQIHYQSNGKQAIQSWDSHTYDLVITDIYLEYFSGIEVIQYIRDRNRKVPILFLLPRINSFILKKAKLFKVQEIILKPFDPIELFSLIQKIQNNKKHESSVELN